MAPGQFELHQHQAVQRGAFGLFVAWTQRLFSGRWHTRLLHYVGQYNAAPGNPQELKGGVIDPSVAQDPATGQLYIAWARQSNQIFVGELGGNGLAMNEHISSALGPTYEWECDPGPLGELNKGCVVEGPVLYYDAAHRVFDLFFNSASTWDGSYKVGVAMSADPMGSWVPYPEPILQSGGGFLGPGIGAQPIDGLVFFHVQFRPSHKSQDRYLAVEQLHYSDSAEVTIGSPNR